MIIKLIILIIIWFILVIIGLNYLTYLDNTHEEKVILFIFVETIWLIIILMIMPIIVNIILN